MTRAMPWIDWVTDPNLARSGLTFDRTPAGSIVAPPGLFRVCAYHVDHDERPTRYLDVATLEEATKICADLAAHGAGDLDYAVAFDDRGAHVAGSPYGA